MKSLRLHPDHGVNATVMVCFWCGKDAGVALLGANYKGEVPSRVLLDKRPCTECTARMALGIAVFEADDTSEHKFTGRWVVITRKAALRIFADAPDLDEAMERGGVKVPRETMEKFLKCAETDEKAERI